MRFYYFVSNNTCHEAVQELDLCHHHQTNRRKKCRKMKKMSLSILHFSNNVPLCSRNSGVQNSGLKCVRLLASLKNVRFVLSPVWSVKNAWLSSYHVFTLCITGVYFPCNDQNVPFAGRLILPRLSNR